MKNGTLFVSTFSLSMLATSWVHAESTKNESDSIALSTVVAAEAIERVEPKYPLNAARRGIEGWVRLSYVVDENGDVKDVLVHDSSGTPSFEKSAVRAISNWRFSPAIMKGKPVEQCDSLVQFDFRLAGKGNGVTRKFKKRYDELYKLVTDGDLEKAEKHFLEFKEKVQKNYAETLHFAVISAIYFEAKGDTTNLINELMSVNRIGHEYLSQQTYTQMSAKLYFLLIESSKVVEALGVYDNLVNHYGETENLGTLSETHHKVINTLDNTDTLVVDGKIDDGQTWHHQLYFNEFDLLSKESPLHRIELRCNNKRATYGNVSQKTFVIPESWGKCHVYIDGPDDAEFILAERRS